MPAAFVAGVFLVSILQGDDWTRVSIPNGHYFLLISLPQIGTRILYSLLSWAPVSSQLVDYCQTLVCVKSFICVGLLGHRSPQY